MSEINIPPFYVGQEIIAIVNCPRGAFKKGDEFTITSIVKSQCKCPGWDITVGLLEPSSPPGWQCSDCMQIGRNKFRNEQTFSSSDFRPKIVIAEFISMKQLAEQQLETIGVN